MTLIGCAWALFAAGADVPPQVATRSVGPLRARIAAPGGPVGLSQAFTARLTLTGPERVAVAPTAWKVGMEVPGAKLLEVHLEGPDKLVGQFGTVMTRSWAFRFEPLALGKLTLPPLEIKYRDGMEAEKSEKIEWPAVEIVAQHSTSGDVSELKPPPFPAERAPAPAKGERTRNALIVGGTLLFALALAGVFTRQAPLSNPVETCRLALADAAALPDARSRVHAANAAVRRYLSARYRLPAETLTTPELAAAELSALPAPQRAALEDFLRAADDRRFPAAGPSDDEAAGALSRAKAFLGGEAPP